jgi:polyphosphate kinase
MVAPVNMRERIMELIRRERKNRQSGKPGRIIAKLNSLTDVEIINELYAAAREGVDIDLLVRGICTLRPGIKGLSQNIRVVSIVGRFLEHSRIYYFANGGADEMYIGSADWMQRNMDRRVEVICPVFDEEVKNYLLSTVLDAYLRDNTNARILRSDGTYKKISRDGFEPFDSQMFFVGRETVY